MRRLSRVGSGMAPGRIVAAERDTALLAGPEMDPGRSDLHALLALATFWMLHGRDGS